MLCAAKQLYIVRREGNSSFLSFSLELLYVPLIDAC